MRELLIEFANQTQMDWIKDVHQSNFWRIIMANQSFIQKSNFSSTLR